MQKKNRLQINLCKCLQDFVLSLYRLLMLLLLLLESPLINFYLSLCFDLINPPSQNVSVGYLLQCKTRLHQHTLVGCLCLWVGSCKLSEINNFHCNYSGLSEISKYY